MFEAEVSVTCQDDKLPMGFTVIEHTFPKRCYCLDGDISKYGFKYRRIYYVPDGKPIPGVFVKTYNTVAKESFSELW